ncbi:hypothetical protein BASA81_002056 [Batrachochytrium salamandrivorans]|nr:hypothetical protein BASA81_002056 [Batrachochytrium salamandrivorans]
MPTAGHFDFPMTQAPSPLPPAKTLTPPLVSPSTVDRVDFLQLPHPGHGSQLATFGFIKSANEWRLAELHRAENDQSSMFVENTVRKDGVLFLCAACDPNFLLLGLLTGEEGRWVPPPQLVHSDEFPHQRLLLKCQQANLELLADVDPSNECVRLNPTKVMSFLAGKVDRLISELVRNQQANKQAAKQTFILPGTSSAPGALPPAVMRECERVAVQMVCDYVPIKWKELVKHQYVQPSSLAATAASGSWEENNGNDR